MKDKVVIITGSGSGIGRAAALLFASKGAKVVVSDVNVSGGTKTVALIQAEKGTATFIPCDVSKKEQVAQLFKDAVAKFGQLDAVVNNAGISGPTKPMHLYEDDTYDKVIAVNLTGVWYCMKEAIRIMLEQGKGGTIVNISSLAGLGAAPLLGAYAASKHGVTGLTTTAAMEYGKYNIRTNAICPTVIETPMTGALTGENSKIYDFMLKAIPMKRFGQPEEVAELIYWLSSPASSYINGEAIRIDGGMRS